LLLAHMDTVQLFFYFVAIWGGVYILLVHRQFDFFSVAFFSACVYFLPGFFGYALAPSTPRVPYPHPVLLLEETYWVMIMVLLAISLGAIIFDVSISRQRPYVALRGTHHAVTLATIVAIVGFFLTVITTGEYLLSPDKLLLLKKLNRWYIIWTTGASVGAVLAYARKRWQPLAVCFLLLLVDMYVGFRVAFATTILTIFTLALTAEGDQRLVLD